MEKPQWKRRSRSHSVDTELESSDSNCSSPSRHATTPRSSLPTFAITPPVSPTRRVYTSESNSPYNSPRYTGSLGRKGVADGSIRLTEDQDVVHVRVFISLTQYKIGSPQNPCSLQALGIVPRRHSITEKGPFSTLRPLKSKSTAPVIVRGVVPSSPVALTGKLHPGDQILMINGQMVNLKNIDTVLSSSTNEILMDVLKYTKDMIPDNTFSPPPAFSSPDLSQSPSHLHIPPLVLLLTLNTREEDPPEADILYRYPLIDKGEPLLIKMVDLRGVVATLCDINSIHFETNDKCVNCSFIVDGEVFNVLGRKFDKEVFILVLHSAKVFSAHMPMIYQTIEDCFKSLYGSLLNGLLSPSGDPAHTLASLFYTLFPVPISSLPMSIVDCHHLSSCSVSFASPLRPTKLQIPSRTKTLISTRLNLLDSGLSRSGSDDVPGPSFIPCGSCLFYRGYLVSSHLSPSLLQGAMAVCLINQLLEYTAANSTVSQTIVWREIYRTDDHTMPIVTADDGVVRGQSTYVLIIAMEQSVLCHVLEGAVGVESAPPSYCKVLRLMIEELYTNGLFSECEGCVLSQTPVLTTADILLASIVTLTHSQRKTHMKRNSAGSLRSLSVSTVAGGSGSDSDSESTGTSAWLSTPQKKKSGLKAKLSASLRKSKSTQTLKDKQLNFHSPNKSPYLLIAGLDNLLLYYLALDVGRGAILCPCREQVGLQSIHKELLQGFRDVVVSIHHVLNKQYLQTQSTYDDDDEEEKEEEEREKGQSSSCAQKKDCSNMFLTRGSSVKEHGILMECTIPNDVPFTAPKLQYWVIGRLFVEKGVELYICYQENMSQISSEMMFKLVFGTPPGP